MFMKLFFKIIFFVFFSQSLFCNTFEEKYSIKTKGLTIGELGWEIKMSEYTYSTSIKLKSEGLLSGLYSFEGAYKTKGQLDLSLS